MNTAMYYAGKAIEGQGPTFEVINPATESVIVKCKAAITAQVNDAVLAAKKPLNNGNIPLTNRFA